VKYKWNVNNISRAAYILGYFVETEEDPKKNSRAAQNLRHSPELVLKENKHYA
jgi:hypothetical protein